jgi:hypothetical protein
MEEVEIALSAAGGLFLVRLWWEFDNFIITC